MKEHRLDQEQIPNATAVIRECLEGSLKRLGQDRVDLFNLHNRIGFDVSGNQGALSVEDVLGNWPRHSRAAYLRSK